MNLKRETILSPCRQYRNCLWRQWDVVQQSYAMFVGLNPSTADEVKDDRTIGRCVDFSKQWGYGALCMVNLFAYRATKPETMKRHASPVGEENDRWLAELVKEAGIVIAAWGANGTHMQRDQTVMHLLAGKLSCLGRTNGGHPKHPLYVRADAKPSAFP